MPLAFARDEHHPMVDTLLRTRIPRWEELNRAIDERDDMLDFAIGLFDHDRDRALTNYFQNGIEQLELVRHIARWRGRIGTMLDFASGYGRLTRFLVHEQLAESITVSDILEEGMEFQREQFGVQTIVSTTLPQNFIVSGRYDLIFVASLFTHLPATTFTAWLRRLTELLTPAGMLVFSVHDESIAPERVDGIAFHSYSESRVLDGEEYGSTWVTETYVREQVAAIDPSFACVRLPRALAEWQDVYVVSPAALPDASPRRTPKGFLDDFAITDEGVQFAGWATGVTENADRVEIRIGDTIVATTRMFEPRPDVAAWVGVESATDSGWRIVVPHAAIRSHHYEVLTISAFTRENLERILFLGPIESAGITVAKERARDLEQQLAVRARELAALGDRLSAEEQQRIALEQLIEAMKASRFWKAREQWFALKAKFGR